MKRKHLLFLLSALLVICNSCKKDKIESDRFRDAVISPNLYPLEVGNYWEYGYMKEEITDSINLNGHIYFIKISFPLNIDTSNINYYVDTNYYRNNGTSTFYKHRINDAELLLYDFSMSKGDEITIPYNNFDAQRNDSEKILLSEKFDTVHLNILIVDSCYKFYYDVIQWADEEHTEWVKPGLGVVKRLSNGWGIKNLLTKAKVGGKVFEF
jgi:hypothetical protein